MAAPDRAPNAFLRNSVTEKRKSLQRAIRAIAGETVGGRFASAKVDVGKRQEVQARIGDARVIPRARLVGRHPICFMPARAALCRRLSAVLNLSDPCAIAP
jgi:hypothetical protein